MSEMKDASETFSTQDKDFLKLQKRVEHLQQENKVLQVRAQGVQVLGKVLQDSQENNARLKKEIEQLKSSLLQKGINAAQADLSLCTVNDDDNQSTGEKQSGSCHSSLTRSSVGIHDYNINVTTVSGPQSLSEGYPSLLPGEFHIKEIYTEFQHINHEIGQLLKEAYSLQENVERLPGNDRDAEIKGKLASLYSKLNEYAKQARTRETLSSALISEEEQLRTKLAAMEEEQASHENVVQELKEKLDQSKEEIGQIQSELKLFQKTTAVKSQHETTTAADSKLSFVIPERSPAVSLSDESFILKSPLSQQGRAPCESCTQLQRQVTELQRLLLQTKAEKDEALKLKEEILDVNHKWDEQYKLLAAANNKEIADLKQQIQVLISTGRRPGQFPEPAMMENRVLNQRCKQLESELQQKQLEINNLQLQMRNHSLPLQYQQPPARQNSSMEPPSSHPSLLGAAALPTGASATAPTTGPPSWPGTTPYNQNIPPEVIDQIEVLKQQLRVYADDFATEREDRERNQAEKEKMRDELAAVKEQVQALEQQVQIYEEDFKREKREKESLQQQLRATSYSTGGGYQHQDPLTERARAVAEQRARVQAIKEVHDRERDRLLRGQQDLQQHVYGSQLGSYSRNQYNPYGQNYTTQDWSRQNYPLMPRGSYPTRGPVSQPSNQRSSAAQSMYHGGEVLPDTVEDVVDSPAAAAAAGNADTHNAQISFDSDKDESIQLDECPRCLRKFNGEDSDTILKHIERCIS